MPESKYIDTRTIGEPTGKRYVRRTYVANEGGDRIVVRAYVAKDGSVIDRDGGRPTVKVVKRRLNIATMRLE